MRLLVGRKLPFPVLSLVRWEIKVISAFKAVVFHLPKARQLILTFY
jgi:hypothetical protein